MKNSFKKLLFILSAVMLFVVLFCFNASALKFTGELVSYHEGMKDGKWSNWTEVVSWNFNNITKELVISGNGDIEYSEYSPFRGSEEILSVVIEEGVTNVGAYMFAGCTQLVSVTIPDSVTCIEKNAFYGCKALKTVKIGNGVETIGSNAFYNCSSLKNIIIPDSVISIGSSAF